MDIAAELGLLGLLVVKEAGLPVPVPGDLLVIGAGVAATSAGGGAVVVGLLLAILVAGYAGGSVQFALVRGAFRRPLLAILRRAGVPEARLERLADWLRRRGAAGVATARVTPGIRVGAIAASGLAGLPFPVFLGGLIVGNGLFVSAHFLVGVIVGPPALAAVSASSGPIAVVVALVVLAILGAGGWIALRRRRRPGLGPGPVTPGWFDGLGSWADAACPACLAVELVRGGSD